VSPGIGAGTAVKYSNGDRTRCRTRVRTGLLLRRQRPRIPGRERSSGPLNRKNALPSSPCPTCPAVSVQGAGSAVPRLTLAADAGGQPGLVLSVVAGIVPVFMDQMGAGARSRPARRRPGLTARAAAPVRAMSPVHHRAGPVRRRGARRRGRGRSARRADRRVAARWSSPARCLGCRGRRAAAGTAGSGRDRPAGTGRVAAGLLADGLTLCLAAGIGCATLAGYLK
jgi:hypothetical protein